MTREQSIIAQARALNVAGRHAGSKPISRLLKGISQISKSNEIAQKAAVKRAKNTPAAPASLSKVHSAETLKAAVETPAETAEEKG